MTKNASTGNSKQGGLTLSVPSAMKDQLFDNQLLNYKKAAQYLSVSESYLRRLKGKGVIPCVYVGDRAVRFRVSSLNLWIEKRETK